MKEGSVKNDELKGLTRRKFLLQSGKIVGLGLMGAGFTGIAGTSQQSMKIGALFPMTGSNAPGGKTLKRAAELAIQQLNDEGGLAGKIPIELIIEDTKTSQEQTVQAAQRLANRGDLSFAVGPMISSFGLAAQPIFAAAKIPHVFFGSTVTFTENHQKYPLSIRYGTQTMIELAPILKYAVEERSQRRLFLVAPNTSRGKRWEKLLKEKVENYPRARLVSTEYYRPFSRDYSTVITKLKASDANALFLATGIPFEIIGITEEYYRQNLKVNQVGVYTSQTPNGSLEVRDHFGTSGKGEGFIYPWLYESPSFERDFERNQPPEEAVRMEEEFQQEFGHDPIELLPAGWGWGSVRILDQAVAGLVKNGDEKALGQDPIGELPRNVVEYILGSMKEGSAPMFSTPFGRARFLRCGQFNVRDGVATFKNGKQYLLKDRGYGDQLVGNLCQ